MRISKIKYFSSLIHCILSPSNTYAHTPMQLQSQVPKKNSN
uniref:Uncharacterized protein n=1 Tax=Rhizophora mucronata TaxID=61149 RepID=A0A2P2J1G4_RHIMU